MLWASFFWLFALPFLFAQKPVGRFLSDSIKIGKPIQYALSFRHDPAWEVFFPDVKFNFQPFEVTGREYFTTQTDQNGSLDSVVYTLVSFEIDKIQRLSLPVYVLSKRDCTAIYATPDSVFLKELIVGALDKLQLKSDTQIIHLDQQINYPLILLVVLVALVVGVLIFWIFGDAIRRQVRIFQLMRRHTEFIRNFQRLGRGITGQSGIENVEKAVVLWKTYVEKLERKPFSSFTTKEIVKNIPDEHLADALREIDITIYGGTFSPKTLSSLAILQEVAVRFYRRKQKLMILEGRKRKLIEPRSAPQV